MASAALQLNDILFMDVAELKETCIAKGVDITDLHLKPELQSALIASQLSNGKDADAPPMPNDSLGLTDKTNFELQIKLKELELAYNRKREREREHEREREREREREHERIREHEREREREFERERMKHELAMKQADNGSGVPGVSGGSGKTKVQSAAQLLPSFTENDVENYFCVFEKTARTNSWPESIWAAVLQAKLCGKALKAFSEMNDVDVTDYKLLKGKILATYELVPEVYRKRFRSYVKRSNDTYSDFAHVLNMQFKRWLSGVDAYDDLERIKQALLIEQFCENVPSDLKMWLVDKGPKTLDEAAKLADQYTVMHKNDRNARSKDVGDDHKHKGYSDVNKTVDLRNTNKFKDRKDFQPKQRNHQWNDLFCAYCRKNGHTISSCEKLRHRNQYNQVRMTDSTSKMSESQSNGKSNNVSLVVSGMREMSEQMNETKLNEPHELLQPYCHIAWLTLKSIDKPIVILRDTGATRSLLSSSCVGVDDVEFVGKEEKVKGITSELVSVPLVHVHLRSNYLKGDFVVGLSDNLPAAVDMLWGNDLMLNSNDVSTVHVVTRSMTNKVQLDAAAVQGPVVSVPTNPPAQVDRLSGNVVHNDDLSDAFEMLYAVDDEPIDVNNVSAAVLSRLQRADPSLAKLFEQAKHVTNDVELAEDRIEYFIQNGVLFRKWRHRDDIAVEGNYLKQIVVPTQLRAKVLQLAHDLPMAGHLGTKKTLDRLLPLFFWPRVSAEVKEYCKTCSKCQLIGKSTAKHKAPLVLPPIIGVPFERISIDIVGPLPRTSSGKRFILTVMDHATRWPDAYALADHTAATVADTMMEYFSRYGFCQELLSDRGTDFMSDLFQCFTYKLGVKQIHCTPAHPQTNGIIEKFHACLKRVLKAYLNDFDGDWDKLLCYAMFAYREVPVVSLGLSPFEILFGTHVKGPLSLVYDEWLSEIDVSRPSAINIVQYMDSLRERLQNALSIVHENLNDAQCVEKAYYDRDARDRTYSVGQKVLVMLPVPGDALSVKYQGPYTVEKQTSPVDYLVRMPGTRRVLRVVHVNRMRPYHERQQYVNTVEQCDNDMNECEEFSVNDVMNDDELGEIPLSPCGIEKQGKVADMLHEKLKHLSDEKHAEMFDLLMKYEELYSDKPGKTNLAEHSIMLRSDAKPVQLRPYRMNPQMQRVLRIEIEQMLSDGLIEESDSEWSSPVVMVPKSDKTFRTCVDYRRVNDMTIIGNFPLPRIDDLIDKIGKSKFMTKFDLTKGFWQIPMDKASKDIVAFVTPFGRYTWNYMPFGLKGSNSTFEKTMCKALKGLEDFTGIYLDDIIVYDDTWEIHLLHVAVVLGRLLEYYFTLKLVKCEFAQSEVDYVGHCIGNGFVRPLEAKVQSLLDFPRPTNRKHVQSLLGLAGYYQRFIRCFSDIVAPLTDLLKKNKQFVWSDDCECSFQCLKARLASCPVLIVPDFAKQFVLFVDCSDVAIGACLAQSSNDDNLYKPVCYMSKKLNVHQKHYTTSEKEALALLTAVRSFRIYLYQKTIVFTDHSPLTFLKRMSKVNQKLLRWMLELEQYDLEIKHVKGADNIIADFLSRPAD
jgi:transposase InsO family protein